MTVKQHTKLSLFSGTALLFFIACYLPFHSNLSAWAWFWFLIGCIGGSMAPDIDTPGTHTNAQMFGCDYKMNSASRKGPEYHSLKAAITTSICPILIGAALLFMDLYKEKTNGATLVTNQFGDVGYYRTFWQFGYIFLFFGIGMLYAWVLHLFHDTASPSGCCWFGNKSYSFKHFRLKNTSHMYVFFVCVICAFLAFCALTQYGVSFARDENATYIETPISSYFHGDSLRTEVTTYEEVMADPIFGK